jgi:hypothetical protein
MCLNLAYSPFGNVYKSVLIASALVVVLGLAGCSINPSKAELQRRALGHSAAYFQRGVTVKDDDLERVAILTTANGVVPPRLLLQKNWSDEYVRGFINKTTGAHSYQIYVVIDRFGWDWIKPYAANFGTPLMSVPTVRINREKACTRKKAPCTRRETIGFALPARELRRVVDTYSAQDRQSKFWKFKVKTKDGSDYVGALPMAEIIGLHRAMQAYKPVPMR